MSSDLKKKEANWTARILLWLFWPVGWLVIFSFLMWFLEAVDNGLTEIAKNAGGIGIMPHVYGVIYALVMAFLVFSFFAGFVIINKTTKNSGGTRRGDNSENGERENEGRTDQVTLREHVN